MPLKSCHPRENTGIVELERFESIEVHDAPLFEHNCTLIATVRQDMSLLNRTKMDEIVTQTSRGKVERTERDVINGSLDDSIRWDALLVWDSLCLQRKKLNFTELVKACKERGYLESLHRSVNKLLHHSPIRDFS